MFASILKTRVAGRRSIAPVLVASVFYGAISCGIGSAQDARASSCSDVQARLRIAMQAKRDLGVALAAHTALDDLPAFDALQRALDAVVPSLSQCGDPREKTRYASLQLARDRLSFEAMPVIPLPDPACAALPADPTTIAARREIAQCEYSAELREVTAGEVYLERRTLLSNAQTQFDTLTANGFDRTDSAEYAADRAFLVSARATMAAGAPAAPPNSTTPAPTSSPSARVPTPKS
jgi:hypothetical protein